MYIGIDVGGTKTTIGIYENLEKIEPIFHVVFLTDKNFNEFYPKLKEILELQTRKMNIKGIGISHTGPIDIERKVCITSANLPDFVNKPLVKNLKKDFNTEVYIENDLVCGAKAEAIFGQGRIYNNSLYFTASTGMGGAYVYKDSIGQVQTQQIEAGFFVIKGNGLRGKQLDMLESYAGGASMEQRFLRKPEEIKDLLFWEEQVKYIATGVINSAVMFNPEIIILGGGIIESNDYVREKLIIEVKNGLVIQDFPVIKISQFKKDGPMIGALSRFLNS